jgi:aspartyl-tRNA(Asn)/glutamyl-tRNA(Gln) amidotransferase subunit C
MSYRRKYVTEINKETIKTLFSLSRISCSEEEIVDLQANLQKIVTYIEQLNELDTENVPACHQVIEGACNVMREDVVGETLSREIFLEDAPSQIGGMIRVPPVFKANS